MPLAPESSPVATDDRDPESLIEVGVYASTREGFEHGLVALALGLPFWLVPIDRGARLMVEPDAAERVREQLRWFDEENARERAWPAAARSEPAGTRRMDFVTPLLWALAVTASFRAQAASGRWSDAGALDAAALFGRGEWWRPLTALFLHADIGHLVSNLLSGVFVFSAVLSALGRARGWLLLAIGAVAGNVAAAAIRSGEAYRSIGASTAVFAALGLLTGVAVRRVAGHAPRGRWRAVFMPLASGLVVLGLFGAGEVRIDVVAHATGFASGLMLGVIGGERSIRTPLTCHAPD